MVFSALSTITNSALQSIGRQKTALRNAAISLGLNVLVVTVILLVSEKPGIYAVLIANIAFSVSILYVWITQIPEEEMRRFPMGTKIVKVLKLLRIYT